MDTSNQAAPSPTPEATAPEAQNDGQANQEAANAPSDAGGTPAVAADGKVDLTALLGEELGANTAFDKFKDGGVQALGKSFLEQGKMLGEANTKLENFKVPETAEGYGFAKPEGMPEGMPYSEEHANAWAETMKEAGVPTAMANALRDKLFAEQIEAFNGQGAEAAEANTRLDEKYTEAFGDQKDVMVQRVKDVLTTAIPDAAMRADLEKTLPNEALLAIGMIDKHYRSQFGQSDQNSGDQAGNSGQSLPELRATAQKLMASEAYRDTMHKDYKETKAKVDQYYVDIGRLTDEANKK